MKKIIASAIFSLSFFSLTAQYYIEPSVAVTTFLEGLGTSNVEKVTPFLSNIMVYQTIVSDKDRNIQTLTYHRENFLYAIGKAPKDSCTETFQLGVSAKDGVLATVWSNYHRVLKKGNIVCGSRVFHLLLLEKGWQIVQGLETQFQQCPNAMGKGQNIELPSPFFKNR